MHPSRRLARRIFESEKSQPHLKTRHRGSACVAIYRNLYRDIRRNNDVTSMAAWLASISAA